MLICFASFSFVGLLIILFFAFLVGKMCGFDRIRHKDDSFFTDDIHLDREESMKAFGANDTLMGLEFLVPDEEARISDS